ncbi:DUF5916 domain-containing protein, partial [Gemmatimonas sp.]|uniref:carbohydrate binding family 9 domain-containing protein n=1 Tax=Gemmatimonas sp. TaxID=1962908 RepID=UPI003982FFAD
MTFLSARRRTARRTSLFRTSLFRTSLFRMSMPARVAATALITTALLVTGRAAHGQTTAPRLDAAVADSFARAARARPRPSFSTLRVTTAPTIDGKLDEAMWSQGTPIRDFVQRELNEGVPASERTEVRLATDGVNLYIGARMYDREPHLIVPGEKIRDVQLANSDHIAFVFDTYHDQQNGFVFATTPAGVEYDGQVIREGEGGGAQVAGQNRMQAGGMGGFNVNWDASWTVSTTVDSLGWTAEFRIPFSTLRYQSGSAEQTWGMNVSRNIRRKNEELYWAFIPRQFNLYRLSIAGNLANLTLPVRRIRTVTPYVLTSSQERWTSGIKQDSKRPTEFGGEIKYGVTPALTLDLTYNTDFSQVEVDQEQVNLTRFSRFFPERRDFFIENAGAFTFGDVEERNFRQGATLRDFTLFNSRRIGITSDGRPVPILGGGRLSGRVGAWNVGLLDMQTRSLDAIPGEQFAVGRARRNVFGNSDIGVLVASRSGNGSYNRSYGADANLRPLPNMVINSYVAASDAPGDSSDGYAARASLGYRGRLWNSSAMWKRVSDQFDPGLGFVRRRGMQQLFATTGIHARPALPLTQEVNPYVQADYITDLSNEMQSRSLEAGLNLLFRPEGEIGVELSDEFDRLDAPFTIYPGQVIKAGSYSWHDATAHYSTGDGRPVAVTVSATAGGFYDGTRRAATTSVV